MKDLPAKNKSTTPISFNQSATNVTEQERSLYESIIQSENFSAENLKQLDFVNAEFLEQLVLRGHLILSANDRDRFLQKVRTLITPESRNKLWQYNHNQILDSIAHLTKSLKRFPSRHEIAKETGLSHKTVNKHLREYFDGNEFKKKKDDYRLMREIVLASAFRHSLSGDMRAAKVFLDATNVVVQDPVIRNQQNNYIQINGLTITQEELTRLPAGKLKQVQKILSITTKALK